MVFILSHTSWLLILIFPAVFLCTGKRFRARPQSDANNLKAHITSDGLFSISVREINWLISAPSFFNADGKTYHAFDNLKLNSTSANNGTDPFGSFQAINFNYVAGASQIQGAVKTYKDQPFIVFTQTYVNGARKTRAANVNYAIAGFPSFLVKDVETYTGKVGYLAYGGMMCGDTEKQFGIFSATTVKMTSGLAGGPVALFDGSGDTLVISPASNFMAASNWFDTKNSAAPTWNYGVMGGVDEIPAGTTVDFIVYYSSGGVNKGFEGWGSLLRSVYKRSDANLIKDVTNNYLGYWTDNGAYYYYNTERNQTYEETMLDIKAYSDKERIPYRYWQYDSWWYYKGVGSGVKTWIARPDIFPDGFQMLYTKMGRLPVTAHNRYWSSDTTYAKTNGGYYNFVIEPITSVPNDLNFWIELMRNSSTWGLHTYEQDWLNKQFAASETLLSDLQLGATWLNQMAQGAEINNMTIQYCMSNSRHVMQALLNSVVTQARASDDYGPGSDQWKIGVSSMLAHALGIAPFKDDFWTTENQPYNPYNHSEPHSELQLIASVLSTGPVGPSDMIGHTNVSLLMRCCNAEGLILKPSKPATAVDDQIYRKALPGFAGVDGEVWSTYSNISHLLFGIIFVPEIHQPFSITPTKAALIQDKSLLVFEAHTAGKLQQFSEQSPLLLSPTACTNTQPCVYHATPVLGQNSNIALLGELSKVVPISPQRVASIEVNSDVIVTLKGVPKEQVPFTFSVDSELHTVTCIVGPSGTSTLSVNAKACK